jgi:hypothetical protein
VAEDDFEAYGGAVGVEVDVRDDLGDQQSGGVGVFGVAGDLEEEGDEVSADLGAGGALGVRRR